MGTAHHDLPAAIGSLQWVRSRAARGRSLVPTDWPLPLATPSHVCLAVQLEGRCTVEQGGRRLRLGPDSWAVCDASVPLRVCHEGRFDQVALLVPQADLSCGPEVHAAYCRALSGSSGTGRLVCQSVRALAEEGQGLTRVDVEGLYGVILRLVRIALESPPVLRHASAASLSEK